MLTKKHYLILPLLLLLPALALAQGGEPAGTVHVLKGRATALSPDGTIRNTYDVRIRNMQHDETTFRISLTSDEILRVELEGTDLLGQRALVAHNLGTVARETVQAFRPLAAASDSDVAISVDGAFGQHSLDAIRTIREKYGPEIHITGGMSNVSFGLPKRKLVNEVYVRLAIDHGADSGIVDPIHLDVDKILNMDMDSTAVKITTEMLMGNDDFCMNYITAFRSGELD